MGTRVVIGAVLIVLAVIVIAACYLAERNPKRPGWANDMAIQSFILPLVVGALFIGSFLMGEGLLIHRESLTAADIIMALSALCGGVVILLLMRIPQRVAAYEAERSATDRPKRREQSLAAGGAEALGN